MDDESEGGEVTLGVTIKASGPNGCTMEALSEMIRARSKELAETSADSVVATAINVLKSLRAGTPLAKKNGARIRVEPTPAVAGWAREGGRRRRVARIGKTHVNFKNWAGGYVRGEVVRVWRVTDVLRKRSFYVAATSEQAVKERAEKQIRARIEFSRGLGKTALSIAMGRVSTKSKPQFDCTGARPRKLADEAAVVGVRQDFDSGEASVSVLDDLEYSGYALKGVTLELAMQRAANSTAGQLNRLFENRGIERRIETPFPEIARPR